ncbi:MAG: hypothetical protein ACI4WR_08065, partial [Bulleidia sp.]
LMALEVRNDGLGSSGIFREGSLTAVMFLPVQEEAFAVSCFCLLVHFLFHPFSSLILRKKKNKNRLAIF